VVLLLGACSDDGGEATTAAEGTLELAPSTTAVPSPASSALLELLVEEPPSPDFVRADDVLGAGPLDLDAAAAGEEDATAERSLLQQRRFEGGASRAWLDPQQAVAYVAIYDFASEADAEAYRDEARSRLAARGASPFEVPDVAGATGHATVEEGPSGTFRAAAVSFTRGRRWVLALVGSPQGADGTEQAVALARTQADRLP
jgi:hypothetical protein